MTTGGTIFSDILNNDKSTRQRERDHFVHWIHLRSMNFNMPKCKSQASLEMKDAGHTCGMRERVLEILTLRPNPLKRDLEAK